MTIEFVDTNVFLYAYDPAAGTRHERARDLVGRLGRERTGALSIQVLQEFYVNAVRKVAQPMSADDARARLRVLGRWRCHAPQPGHVIGATVLAQEHTLSFWDAMIVQSASEVGAEILWTDDLHTGQEIAGVAVMSPFA